MPFGKDSASRLRVVDLDTITGMDPEFHQTPASKETGRYALELESLKVRGGVNDFVVGIGDHTVVERDRLGDKGMALYQADFYIPPGKIAPAIAVVATEPLLPPPPKLTPMPRDFYRFGISAKGFYFSCTSKNRKEIEFYKRDLRLWDKIPRPGWHRLAIVFEGSDTIRCYVDGRETSFSPVKHSALRNLQVGIMQSEDRAYYKTYVDNLSIQLSDESLELPDSPYKAGWKLAAARKSGDLPALADIGGGVEWLDPEKAWTRAQETKKPLLLYFNAPSVPATGLLNDILKSNPDARSFLSEHSCAQVDVDQLTGGSIAGKYGIFKVPSFLIITPQATEGGRANFPRNGTWEEFRALLAPQSRPATAVGN